MWKHSEHLSQAKTEWTGIDADASLYEVQGFPAQFSPDLVKAWLAKNWPGGGEAKIVGVPKTYRQGDKDYKKYKVQGRKPNKWTPKLFYEHKPYILAINVFKTAAEKDAERRVEKQREQERRRNLTFAQEVKEKVGKESVANLYGVSSGTAEGSGASVQGGPSLAAAGQTGRQPGDRPFGEFLANAEQLKDPLGHNPVPKPRDPAEASAPRPREDDESGTQPWAKKLRENERSVRTPETSIQDAIQAALAQMTAVINTQAAHAAAQFQSIEAGLSSLTARVNNIDPPKEEAAAEDDGGL